MPRIVAGASVLALVALVACGRSHRSTQFSEVRLDSAEASIGGLGYVGTLAELPDGQLVVPQPGGPAVLVVNLDDQSIDTLGRAGDGPGEYRVPTVALVYHSRPGIVDPQQQRITWWNRDGTADSTTTIPVLPSWTIRADTLGYLYAEQPSTAGFIVQGQEIDTTGVKDSTRLYRIHPPDAGQDTVGRLYEVGWAVVKFRDGVTRMRRLYESGDQWGVLPDGSLWILRGQQNRVDRRTPDGKWTIGVPRPWTPIKTTKADRQYLAGRFIPASDSVEHPMVDVKGPFQDAVAADDGEVWARLNAPAGDSVTRYELFPVTGPSSETVILPAGRQVVLVSARSVYAVHEDADGFQVVERYGRGLTGGRTD